MFGEMRRTIDCMAFTWIGPVFFVELGTKILFDLDIYLSVAPYVAVLFFAVAISQIVSASIAARYLGHFEASQSLLIGLGMLGRAELSFVVMDIAYVQNDILNTEAFYTLMITAFFLNISIPVFITLWKRAFLPPGASTFS